LSDAEQTRENDRTLLSTAGEKGLPAVLIADRENVVLLISTLKAKPFNTEIFFEALETLDAHTKGLLIESLWRAAEFVAASITSEVYLPQCRQISATRSARLWGSFRRFIYRRQHILKKAAALSVGMLVGVRALDQKTRMEVIFEEGLLESLLNAEGKGRLLEMLQRAIHVLEIRGGRAFKTYEAS
jgi:hypothetical protein